MTGVNTTPVVLYGTYVPRLQGGGKKGGTRTLRSSAFKSEKWRPRKDNVVLTTAVRHLTWPLAARSPNIEAPLACSDVTWRKHNNGTPALQDTEHGAGTVVVLVEPRPPPPVFDLFRGVT